MWAHGEGNHTKLEASLSDPSGVFLFVGFPRYPCASSPPVTPAVWGQMVTSYATGVCRDRPYQRHASGIEKGWLSATSKGHYEWSILWKNVLSTSINQGRDLPQLRSTVEPAKRFVCHTVFGPQRLWSSFRKGLRITMIQTCHVPGIWIHMAWIGWLSGST